MKKSGAILAWKMKTDKGFVLTKTISAFIPKQFKENIEAFKWLAISVILILGRKLDNLRVENAQPKQVCTRWL